MNKYLISQLLVIIATIVIAFTYVSKSKKKILILFIIYNIFYGIHYLLLDAFTGFFMNLVSVGRNVFFFYNNKNEKRNGIIILMVLFSIIIGFGVYSYQDCYSLVSMSASLLSTYSVWQNNIKKYRYIAVIVSIEFIIYAVHINSLFAIITEIFLLFVELIGIYLNRKQSWLLKNSISTIEIMYFISLLKSNYIEDKEEIILWKKNY